MDDKPLWSVGNSIITEHSVTFCKECGSSIKRKFLFFKILGCIQPLCKNYYKGEVNDRNNKN